MHIKPDVIQYIHDNQSIKIEICRVMKISTATLYRWLADNNIQLMDSRSLKVMAISMNRPIDSLYETSPEIKRWQNKQNEKSKAAKRLTHHLK